MTKRLLPIWQAFEQQSLSGAPIEQRVEMQKAFFMGASALLSILQSIPDDVSEEEGAQVFEEAYQECNAYLEAAVADYQRRKPRGFGRRSDRNG